LIAICPAGDTERRGVAVGDFGNADRSRSFRAKLRCRDFHTGIDQEKDGNNPHDSGGHQQTFVAGRVHEQRENVDFCNTGTSHSQRGVKGARSKSEMSYPVSGMMRLTVEILRPGETRPLGFSAIADDH
jgi:hypothetical protein